MSDDDMRPLRRWPLWRLTLTVNLRLRKTMWAEAYFELLERAKDAAEDYACAHGDVYVVEGPTNIN